MTARTQRTTQPVFQEIDAPQPLTRTRYRTSEATPVTSSRPSRSKSKMPLSKRLMIVATVVWPIIGFAMFCGVYSILTAGYDDVGGGYVMRPGITPLPLSVLRARSVLNAGFLTGLVTVLGYAFTMTVLAVVWFCTKPEADHAPSSR